MASVAQPGWTKAQHAQATQLYEDLRAVAARAVETGTLTAGMLNGAVTAFMGDTLGRTAALSTATQAEFAHELEEIFAHVLPIAMDTYAMMRAKP